jgi:MscS family membrane protein
MRLKSPIVMLACMFVGLLFFSVAASAQITPAVPEKPAPSNGPAKPAADPLGRDNPQGMVRGLMGAFASKDYARAQRFFETEWVYVPGQPMLSGAELARRFHEVLDRGGTVTTPAELSPAPEGSLDDGLAENLEQFGSIKIGHRAVKLMAKRVEREGAKLWLVSAETLGEIAALSDSWAYKRAQQSLLDWLPQGPSLGGVPLSHWLALLVLVAASFVLSSLLIMLRRPVLWLLGRRRDETRLSHFVEASAMPLRLTVAMALIVAFAGSQTLGLSVIARYYAAFLAQIVAGIGLAWLAWRIAETASLYALDQMSRRGQVAAYSVVSFLKRMVQVAIVLVFLFVLIRSFGIDVTTALAALGIGGLAVALGAQKLFENLIGSLTVIADRPVRVGDFCRFGTTLGTVEDIGIRSTRVRTLNRTILTVPNGEFSAMQIENYAHRDRFLFNPVLNLRYETTPEQIRYLLQELRAMLYAHPRVDPNPARVRFVALGAHSLDLEIFAYVRTGTYNEFLEIQEDLLLRCMDIVNRSGTGFAFPSQTLYVARDGGLDRERTRAAEDAVRQWRDSQSLQVPRFNPDRIDELRETIAYPPEGAAINRKS